MVTEKKNNIVGGKADGLTPKDIADKHGVSLDSINKEIKAGLSIESEHTGDKNKMREIVLDHLFEFPDYYTGKNGLDDMEKKLKKESTKLIKSLLREALNKLV